MQYVVTVLILLFAFTTHQSYADTQFEHVKDLHRKRIENTDGGTIQLNTINERVYSEVILPEFYSQNNYNPVWIDDNGLRSIVDDMVIAIKDSRREGLYPHDYHLFIIETLLQSIIKMEEPVEYVNEMMLVDLELLLSDAFVILGSHYLDGKVNPETLNPNWNVARGEVDLKSLLLQATKEGTIKLTLEELLPEYPEYKNLRNALVIYREYSEKGGWPTIPAGPAIRKGDEDERIPILRDRLKLPGDHYQTEKPEKFFLMSRWKNQ